MLLGLWTEAHDMVHAAPDAGREDRVDDKGGEDRADRRKQMDADAGRHDPALSVGGNGRRGCPKSFHRYSSPRSVRPSVAGCAASGSYCGRASIQAEAPRAGDVARPGRAPSLELPAANPNISPLFLTSAQANAYANAATNDSRATRLSAQFLHEIQRYSPQRVSVSAESLSGEK
jgi:hypothetical protein